MEQSFNITTLFDYIQMYYPNLFFWDGFSKHEKRNPAKSYKHRGGMPNEIRIEFDSKDTNKNWENINQTAINLWGAGYSFAVFYVEGGRSPHLHLYDCDELDNFKTNERNSYRIKFLQKFCPKESNPDFGLCDEKHLCALEFAIHFKYKKPKQLLSFFDNGRLSNQSMDNEIRNEFLFGKKKKVVKKIIKKRLKFGDMLRQKPRDKIISLLNFEKVFDKYGVEYRGKMALCPFHADKDKSLSFSNEKGLWKCFGCNVKGDIITMIKMLMEVKK